MTIGKTLWIIILVKLFIFFVVIKFIFFPNLLKENFDTDAERADHVRQELLRK
jgi:flagellar basal body-associated protein FliL